MDFESLSIFQMTSEGVGKISGRPEPSEPLTFRFIKVVGLSAPAGGRLEIAPLELPRDEISGELSALMQELVLRV